MTFNLILFFYNLTYNFIIAIFLLNCAVRTQRTSSQIELDRNPSSTKVSKYRSKNALYSPTETGPKSPGVKDSSVSSDPKSPAKKNESTRINLSKQKSLQQSVEFPVATFEKVEIRKTEPKETSRRELRLSTSRENSALQLSKYLSNAQVDKTANKKPSRNESNERTQYDNE